MPLPLQIDSAALLEFLIADINTAWGIETIYTDDPEDASGETSASLPEAFISLRSGSWDGEWASIGDDHAVLRWVIVGRFVRPDGARLQVEKVERVNELLALLTASPRYHGAVWFPQGVSFDIGDNRAEGAQNYYEVTITFTVEA